MTTGRLIDGKYELLSVLGQGGMGAVHLAKNLGTGRQVALKLLISDAAASSPETLARFLREAQVLGSVDHPNCCQIFDAGRDRDTGTPYLVMELLQGEDISKLIQRLGPLPPELALRIAVQALRGISAAHKQGVIHRDIKPANLFLARKPDELTVKVLDFGIGRLMSGGDEQSGQQNVTKTGGTLGSPMTGSYTDVLQNVAADLEFHAKSFVNEEGRTGQLQKRFDESRTRLEAQSDLLSKEIGDETDADLAEVSIRLNTLLAQYEASAKTFAELSQLSLLRYI